MGKYTSKIISIMLILIFTNSLVFYQLNMPEEQQSFDFLDSSYFTDRNIIDNRGNNIDERVSNNRIRQELIEGDFKTKAFFAYDTWSPSLDDDGPGYQWAEYDDIPGHDASATLAKRFCVGTDIGDIPNWPPANNQYVFLTGRYTPYYNSSMFSPVFDQEYTIDGKVHYLINIHRDFNNYVGNDDIQVTYRVRLWHYNSTDSTSTQITSLEYLIPDAGGGEYWTDFTLDSTIPAPTIIPVGDRLKVTYEVKLDNITHTGHTTVQIAYNTPTTGINWNIVDGIYSNTYTLSGVQETLGVQLYMRSNEYPNIDLFNANNNTVYQVAQEMTIDVTDGSISKYRWDGGSWNSFSDSTLATLPSTHDWHDLEIVASDPVYNNTQTAYYQIGYDASIMNIELNPPFSNGSNVDSGSLLNFSAYYVDTVTYEWDANGTIFPLVDPYDILAPVFEELHNLTIRTTDYYTSDAYIYFFYFDSDVPVIQLDNVVNGSTYAPLKTIDVEITDTTGIKNVKYHWDSDANTTWNPESGSIYRTNLPITDGNHFLYVFAVDNFDHWNSKVFYFYADSNIFLVELQDLTNDTYYQGGETVRVTIQKSNGTVKYVWDSGTIQDGTIISSTLTLEGSEGIPLTAGPHKLTIITADITDIPFIFYFNFIVDLEAPVIDSSIDSYNNTRYKTSTDFDFIITDNYVSGSNLTVLISVDGKANRTLVTYTLDLSLFEDGNHSFYLYAIDLAGNTDVKYIFFIIDTTAPTFDVDIVELVEYIGQFYVPGNAEVIIENLDDDDPSISLFWKWLLHGSYDPFTDNFFLPNINEIGTLYIWVQDSLMNFIVYSIDLIIDVDSPTVTLQTYENATTEINFETNLYFVTDDYSDNTIETIRYTWDKLGGFWFTSPINDFSLQALPIYSHDAIAEFYVFVEDIVGNNFTYTFSFIIDIEAPIIDLRILDATENEWVDISYIDHLQTSEEIVYTDSVNDDLILFEYAWNWDGIDTEYLRPLNESVSWTIYAPDTDGSYNLTVILTDDTNSSSPNVNSQVFYFLVDKIILNFNDPLNFDSEPEAYVNSTDLIYGNNVSFELNVTDAVGAEIIGLKNSIIKDEKLNIYVELNKLPDNISYEIFILATNVTDGVPTKIEIQFFKYNESKQLIWIYLDISKKEGSLTIEPESELEVTFEEDIIVIINLDNDIGDNVTINYIIIDSAIEILDFIALQNGFFQFTYNSRAFGEKGNYSLEIYVESNFFKANNAFDVEVNPIGAQISVEITEFEVIEGAQLVINGQLTMINGTPIALADVIITLYIIERENGRFVYAYNVEDYDDTVVLSATTDFDGYFTQVFTMTDEINYVDIEVSYIGDDFYGTDSSELGTPIYSIPPPGLPSWLLYTIIGGSLVLALIVSLVVYKLTRRKPFQQFLDDITDEEIENNYSIFSPGVVLSIFDQRKGPVPLVMDHSLKAEKYSLRLRMGTENFILKISDQAYSSLGFEEHDVGRRVGSIVLPGEKMVGWVHGVQLPNEAARGGFENLSLIVLADSEFGSYLLNYQEYLYDEADLLGAALKSKKELTEVNDILTKIRKKSVRIMLAAQRMEG